MEQWEEHGPETIVTTTPTRIKWFIMLGQSLEEIEAAYIMGQIDRDEFEKQLQDLDGKLSIIGLALASKPWLKTSANRL
jgi:hypothetical protein